MSTKNDAYTAGTSAAAAPMAFPPLIDLDENPVQGQINSAVLDLKGQMVRGQLKPQETSILYRMLLEVGTLNEPTFQRMTVTSMGVRYIIARDENHIYIVQVQARDMTP